MMTFHATRQSPARGSKCPDAKSPKISVTLPEADMALLCWWAEKVGVPAATVIRNALWTYLQCVKFEFDREREK